MIELRLTGYVRKAEQGLLSESFGDRWIEIPSVRKGKRVVVMKEKNGKRGFVYSSRSNIGSLNYKYDVDFETSVLARFSQVKLMVNRESLRKRNFRPRNKKRVRNSKTIKQKENSTVKSLVPVVPVVKRDKYDEMDDDRFTGITRQRLRDLEEIGCTFTWTGSIWSIRTKKDDYWDEIERISSVNSTMPRLGTPTASAKGKFVETKDVVLESDIQSGRNTPVSIVQSVVRPDPVDAKGFYAVIPSGEGKTRLSSVYSSLFFDIDAAGQLPKLNISTKVGEAWFYKSVPDFSAIGKKVLLVSKASSAPDDFACIGEYALCQCPRVHPHIGDLQVERSPMVRLNYDSRQWLSDRVVCLADFHTRDLHLLGQLSNRRLVGPDFKLVRPIVSKPSLLQRLKDTLLK
jgi:hypothetical protein